MRSHWPQAAICLAAAAAAPIGALAVEKDWNPAILSGDWSNAANWLQAAPPVDGDDVLITKLGDPLNHVVNFGGPDVSVNTLTVDNASAGSTNTLVLSTASLTVLNTQYIGVLGSGALTQTGGNNFTNYFLSIARGANSSGTYTQSAGFSRTPLLTISDGANSTGVYNLSGVGSLTVTGSGSETIGNFGKGTFNQTGGSHNTPTLFLGNYQNAKGTYALSGAGNLAVTFNEYVGYLGNGAFTQSGGTHTIGGALTIADSAGSAGSYALSAGTLSAASTINNGLFNQTGGVASLGPLSGAGTLSVGGGGSSALLNVASFDQQNVTIASGGTMIVGASLSPTTLLPRVTNAVSALQITGSGVLDINNHDILIDNAATPFATTLSYWRAGYNNDPNAGVGLWDGNRGITSSVARASAQDTGRITVGYLDGAAQNDPNIGSFADNIGGPALATNRTLIHPALMGDLNLDGVVDGNDIGIMIGLGYYGKSSAPHGWLDGDLNGDGLVDGNDIGLIIGTGTYGQGSFGGKHRAAKAAATLTASSTDLAATTTHGGTGDGKMDFIYNVISGDVFISYDGDTRIDAAGGHPLQRLRLASAAGKFRTANLNTSGFATATNTDTLLDCAQTAGAIPDGYDLGMILPAGLTEQELLSDMTLNWQVQGGGVVLKAGDFAGIPEPTTLGLIGVGAVGLLARRRKPR